MNSFLRPWYIDSQVCFHWWLFSSLSNYEGAPQSLHVAPVNGINKGLCGAKLHPTAVLAYPVDCDCLCHLLGTQYCCLCLNGRLGPPSVSHPFIHAVSDITAVKIKVALGENRTTGSSIRCHSHQSTSLCS